ncbi:uncharacterized protein LOC110867267 [Helianthus annuus]|uniref:uncharacterized protein LOC110867267 n=1 Tax=Helianthus annuus TaxID=4232 RepID=UPI000B909C10|nr:uncharacterized protein LOC110867267 [Helianthus annuus]
MEQSKNLHNFTFPTGLRWGKQHLLRCIDPVPAMHVFEDNESSDLGEANQNPSAGQPRSTYDRQKKLDFGQNSSSSSIKASSPPNEGEENSPPPKYKCLKKLTSKASSPSSSPAIHSKDGADGGNIAEADGRRWMKTRPRRNLDKKEERPKFSIQLSRKEIEEDFIAMTGKKPPRKPNKPPRSLQVKLDALSPGLHLSKVHKDRYKVNENGKM